MITKQGLLPKVENGKNVLTFDGEVIDKTPCGMRNSYGLYIDGKRLSIDGAAIAESASSAALIPSGGSLFLNEVDLLPSGVCINISIEDYNRLVSGETVAGYKRYNPLAVYNIVSDVSVADEVTYTVSEGVISFSNGVEMELTDNALLNNGSGAITENRLDKTATMLNTDPPFVDVRHFEPIVPVGGAINVRYYVDARTIDSLNVPSFGRTFTVIITTPYGVKKKTTYAGEFALDSPAFSGAGETWLSVQCIDSRGIGSAVQYYDILVRDAVTDNHYTMLQEDLEEFGIAIDDDDEFKAYDNKAALSAFFADIKQKGYNGVKMLEGVYWINYHKNLSNEPGAYDFGRQTYFRVSVANKVITSVENVTEQQIINYGDDTILISSVPSVGGDMNVEDGQKSLVLNTSTGGDNIVFPNGFTVDLNGATIAATQCVDVHKGDIIRLDKNFDTHIINGYIRGIYGSYDFDTAKRRQGTAVAGEALRVTTIHCSRYCSLQDLDVSGSVGYDGYISGDYNDPSCRKYNLRTNDANGKRIDIDTGEVVSANNMVVFDKNSSGGIFDVEGRNELCLGRGGYAGYYIGRQRELFYSFYKANDDYICTVKSKLYFLCKVPAEAKYVKITGYGSSSDFPGVTNNGYLTFFIDVPISKNILIKNCHWHDTRTSAITPEKAKGVHYMNCTFTDIATETRPQHSVTTMLSDFEDGWQWLNNVCIENCECVRGHGQTLIVINFCNSLNFIGNKGIRLYNSGGIESGFIEDNDISIYDLIRNKRSFFPFVIYRGNHFAELSIAFNGDKTDTLTDADINPYVAMENTTIDKKCTYEGLRLRNSLNGGESIL